MFIICAFSHPSHTPSPSFNNAMQTKNKQLFFGYKVIFSIYCITKFLETTQMQIFSLVIMHFRNRSCHHICNLMDVFYVCQHVPEIQAVLKLGTWYIFGPMLSRSWSSLQMEKWEKNLQYNHSSFFWISR